MREKDGHRDPLVAVPQSEMFAPVVGERRKALLSGGRDGAVGENGGSNGDLPGNRGKPKTGAAEGCGVVEGASGPLGTHYIDGGGVGQGIR